MLNQVVSKTLTRPAPRDRNRLLRMTPSLPHDISPPLLPPAPVRYTMTVAPGRATANTTAHA